MPIDFKAYCKEKMRRMRDEKGLLPADSLRQADGTYSLEDSKENHYPADRSSYSKKAIPALYNILVLGLHYLESSDIEPSKKLLTNLYALDYELIPHIVDAVSHQWGKEYLALLKEVIETQDRYASLSSGMQFILRILGDKPLANMKELHAQLSERVSAFEKLPQATIDANILFDKLNDELPVLIKKEKAVIKARCELNDLEKKIVGLIANNKLTDNKEIEYAKLKKLKDNVCLAIDLQEIEAYVEKLTEEQVRCQHFSKTIWFPYIEDDFRSPFAWVQNDFTLESNVIPVVSFPLRACLNTRYQNLIDDYNKLITQVNHFFIYWDTVEAHFTPADKKNIKSDAIFHVLSVKMTAVDKKIANSLAKIAQLDEFFKKVNALNLTELVEDEALQKEINDELERDKKESSSPLFTVAQKADLFPLSVKARKEFEEEVKAKDMLFQSSEPASSSLAGAAHVWKNTLALLLFTPSIPTTQRAAYANQLKSILLQNLNDQKNELQQLEHQKEKITQEKLKREALKKASLLQASQNTLLDSLGRFINNTSWSDWFFQKNNIFNACAKQAEKIRSYVEGSDFVNMSTLDYGLVYLVDHLNKQLLAAHSADPRVTSLMKELSNFNVNQLKSEESSPVPLIHKLNAFLTICRARKASAFWTFLGFGNVYNGVEMYLTQMIAQSKVQVNVLNPIAISNELTRIYNRYFPANKVNEDKEFVSDFVGTLSAVLPPAERPAQDFLPLSTQMVSENLGMELKLDKKQDFSVSREVTGLFCTANGVAPVLGVGLMARDEKRVGLRVELK